MFIDMSKHKIKGRQLEKALREVEKYIKSEEYEILTPEEHLQSLENS